MVFSNQCQAQVSKAPIPLVVTPNATHVDTVKLGHAYRVADLPSIGELKKFNFDISHKIGRNAEYVVAMSIPSIKKSYEPRLKVILNNYGYSGIKVEVSIAKLLDGNGLGEHTDEDIETALDAIEDFIRSRIGIYFDARTAKINRFDANADYFVGEEYITSFVN